MASEGESFQIHEEMKQAEHDISRKQINSTLKVLGQSPLVLHSKPKQNRRALVKRKLKAVTQNLNESFSSVAGTNELDISIDEQPYASYSQHADRDLNRLMSDLKTRFEKATIHANKIQILTLKPASWTIDKTAECFQCTHYAVRQVNAQKMNMVCFPDQYVESDLELMRQQNSWLFPFMKMMNTLD